LMCARAALNITFLRMVVRIDLAMKTHELCF
jgi:hypothetical protein